MKPIPIIDASVWMGNRAAYAQPWHRNYYAFYSSVLGGITTDPLLMAAPFDDHLVHRGDGVFETAKCVEGAIYALRPHLARLRASAERIGLARKWTDADLSQLIVETVRSGGRRDALIRLILSRGGGSMGINPADCPEPHLYILAYAANRPFMDAHPEGAKAVTVDVPLKPSWFATIKTCNYLPNAMMKRAAAAAGADFPVAFDERGFLAEGATENLGIVTRDGQLRLPKPDRILSGITVQRAAELAQELVRDGRLAAVENGDIDRASVAQAAEVLVFGTTPDVTAVTRFDGKPVGDGRPGSVQSALNRLLTVDIRTNAAWRTPGGG